MEAAAGREVKGKVKYLQGAFRRSYGPLADQLFHAPGAKPWHYAAELLTLSVTYSLCSLALTDTMDNLSEMCPAKLMDFYLFCTINHSHFYKGRLFHQCLSQVVMTRAQTCYTQKREPAL